MTIRDRILDSIKSKENCYLYLVLTFSAILLYLGFFKIINDPNNILYNSTGDGLKNYYSYLYHVTYGKTTQFQGMFYPYGTHVLFVDAEPLLVYINKSLSYLFPSISNHYIGIFNLSILFAFWIAGFYIYKILTTLELPPYFAALLTIPILFLSPQQYRIVAHFGLAFICFIPMFLFWLMRFEKSHKIKYIVYLGLITICSTFFHAYYLGLFTILIGFYSLIKFIRIFKKEIFSFKYLTLKFAPLIAVGICYILFILFMTFTDNEKDRVLIPYGHIDYRTTIEGVFIPLWGPIFDFINTKLVRVAVPGFESYAYLGLSVSIFVIILLGISIANLIKKCFKKSTLDFNSLNQLFQTEYFKAFFYTSLLILFMSMAIPFRLNSMWILEYIPGLKQFRSLGRLGWVFYYIMAFLFSKYLWIYVSNISISKLKKMLLMGLVIPLWYYDAFVHFTGNIERMEYAKNTFASDNKSDQLLDSIHKYKPQSMVSNPLFFVGTDKIGEDPYDALAKESMTLSYQLQLPMIDALAARMSVSKSREMWSIYSNPILLSEIWHKLALNPNPILVLELKSSKKQIEYLYKLCRLIYQDESFAYYLIYPKDVIEYHNQYLTNLKNSLVHHKKNENYFYRNYDETRTSTTYQGNGAKKISNNTIIYEGTLSEITNCDSVEISFWVYDNIYKTASACPRYKLFDYLNQLKFKQDIANSQSHDIDGNWQRHSIKIKKPEITDKVVIEVDYPDTWIDEFLIKPVNSTFYFQTYNNWMYNNYFISDK